MKRRADEVKAPALAFQEADLSIRVLRDVLTKEFDGAVIDDEKQHSRVTSFFQRTAPELVEHVELYTEPQPLLVARASSRRSARCSRAAPTWPRAGI